MTCCAVQVRCTGKEERLLDCILPEAFGERNGGAAPGIGAGAACSSDRSSALSVACRRFEIRGPVPDHIVDVPLPLSNRPRAVHLPVRYRRCARHATRPNHAYGYMDASAGICISRSAYHRLRCNRFPEVHVCVQVRTSGPYGACLFERGANLAIDSTTSHFLHHFPCTSHCGCVACVISSLFGYLVLTVLLPVSEMQRR